MNFIDLLVTELGMVDSEDWEFTLTSYQILNYKQFTFRLFSLDVEQPGANGKTRGSNPPLASCEFFLVISFHVPTFIIPV